LLNAAKLFAGRVSVADDISTFLVVTPAGSIIEESGKTDPVTGNSGQ